MSPKLHSQQIREPNSQMSISVMFQNYYLPWHRVLGHSSRRQSVTYSPCHFLFQFIKPSVFPRNIQPTRRFFCQLEKINSKDAEIDMQLWMGMKGHNKLPPTHGSIFCRLTVCRQKQQKLMLRPYSWAYFILIGLFHTDWLLFGCQRMDHVQKLK